MSYGDSCSHPSGFEQGNIGYSGTPLWKIRQQMQLAQAARAVSVESKPKDASEDTDSISTKCPRLVGDAVVLSVEQSSTRKAQALARHVIVRDFRKVAGVLKIPLPKTGIFKDGDGLIPCALFALFDGQRGPRPGPKAAEFYCRNMPARLLGNLAIIPSDKCNQIFVKSALLKSFEDLEAELVKAQVTDRCAASLALVVGDVLFTAVLGGCGALLSAPPVSADSKPGGPTPIANGTEPEVFQTREMGQWRQGGVQTLGAPDVVSAQVTFREGSGRPPFFVLAGATAAEQLNAEGMASLAGGYPLRPRAASGAIAARARAGILEAGGEEGADCAVLAVFCTPPEAGAGGGAGGGSAVGEPPLKKAKTLAVKTTADSLQSVRLRHILVRHKDAKHAMDPVKGKMATRSRAEAEEVLRRALLELLKDGEHRGDTMWAAKSTPRIIKLCRDNSECKSALKGGSTCGDLGWLGKKELQNLGKDIEEAVRNLSIAEWSDLLQSDQGVHLMMRIA